MARETAWRGRLTVNQDIDGFEARTGRQFVGRLRDDDDAPLCGPEHCSCLEKHRDTIHVKEDLL